MSVYSNWYIICTSVVTEAAEAEEGTEGEEEAEDIYTFAAEDTFTYPSVSVSISS